MKLALAVGVSSFSAYRFTRTRALCSGDSTTSSKVEVSKFINAKLAHKIKDTYQTPVYVYDEASLREQATKALSFPHTNGLTVRFAMKSCPNAAILQLFNSMGVNFDASSGYEVERAIRAGIYPSKISLSSQELPLNFKELIERGIEFNACSLHQLESFGKLFPGRSCGIRFNPGKGSGGTGKTNVGGSTASFGIWYESQSRVQEIANKYNLKITRIHTHIGSGSDPDIWQAVSIMSLNIVRAFPDVTTLNLGGGYKVGRMSYEKSTDLQQVGKPVSKAFDAFKKDTGRAINLEIEPGTFLVANAGVLLATVQDVVSTGEGGHTFLKLDAGMTEVLRPSLYGAQHPIVVHSATQASSSSSTNSSSKDATATGRYVVVGHCCESGDLFTCAPGDPETIAERTLSTAAIGDLVTIEGAGAYCSSMSTKNYNSFPEAAEVMLDTKGELHLIRRRQTLSQILENEVRYK